MANRYLITPSLFSAWLWHQTADEDHADDARRDLITYLKREPITPSEHMLKGRKLEDDIRAAAEGEPMLPLDDPSYEATVREIAEIIKGGLWQEKTYTDIKLGNHGDFLLYGKIDVVRRDWIFDIKYTTNYEVGKYWKGIQHIAYPAGLRCPHFAYLASNGKVWWREDYHYSQDHYDIMRSRLIEMLDDIKRDKELGPLYDQHWKADREHS